MSKRVQNGGRRSMQNTQTIGRGVLVSVSKAKELVGSARTDLASLCATRENILAFPATYQTDAFDVFCHHFQTSVVKQLSEKDDPYEWIMECLRAIRKLGWAFFDRDDVSKRRFVQCWPHIFKWMKALLKVRPTYDEGGLYSGAIGEIYNICVPACPNVLEEDEVVEFAVRAWIGIEKLDEEGSYTVRALLACLGVCGHGTHSGCRRMERALHACDITAEDLVDKIIARLKWETFQSPSTDVVKMLNICKTAAQLVSLRGSFLSAMFRPAVGRCFVVVLNALLDHKTRHSNRLQAILSILTVIYGSLLPQTVEYALNVTEEGLLALLPKIASLDSGSKDVLEADCSLLASEIINQLLICLTCDYEIIDICQKEMEKIHKGDYQLKAMLNASSKTFRDVWALFEGSLLESIILSRLLQRGYAPEEGVCANCDCRGLGDRKDYKKCAGCLFAVYCSRSCQKADWNSHRHGCRTVRGISLNIMSDLCNRLPRKMNTFYVNRHWDSIVRLSRKKDIPLKDLAVRISCDRFPFRLQVFDCHELLKETGDKAHLAMAAYEKLRQSEEDRCECMVVVIRTLEMEYPFVVHIDDKWTRAVQVLEPHFKTKGCERSSFVDEDGNALVCEKFDALCAGIRFANEFAAQMGKTVWNSIVIMRATNEFFDDSDSDSDSDSDESIQIGM
ncbi:hypothetical protein SCHPADRAFT_931587 [Schizopora paradoxa]|uniref:MYND-type domain-containing protein n=1 Tax=Schizopora paradoxa TaxID=27342 RepID=A0A0H2RA50_9AGAM|nr:hypothetical protein SCHPADRAFT_931587 [Schizopora paradoxa]